MNTSFLSNIVSNYKQTVSTTTGINIYGDGVYAYASGVVLAVGKDEAYYTVTVQYDTYSCLRYGHLDNVDVSAGDIIQSGFRIGQAHKFVHFEYVTKSSSIWPVRVGTETYYKQDPAKMIGV